MRGKIKGRAEVLKGRGKQGAGHATGSKRLQVEGKADRVMGNVRHSFEKVKDAFKH